MSRFSWSGLTLCRFPLALFYRQSRIVTNLHQSINQLNWPLHLLFFDITSYSVTFILSIS